MRKSPYFHLFFMGVFILLGTSLTFAQDDDPPEYIGSRECSFCHTDQQNHLEQTTHARTLRATRRFSDEILADFSAGAEIRTLQFPDESQPRPFTPDDIAYILGTGRYVQRYVYEDGQDYLVFPAEWNTQSNEWQSYDRGADWNAENYGFIENCAYCHTTGLYIEDSEWVEDAVTCEMCHGAGADHADLMFELDSSLSAEDRLEVEASVNRAVDPQTCGQCHSVGTNADGKAYPTGYYAHGSLSDSFSLVAPDDQDHWWAGGYAAHSQMQYNEWIASDHANALSTALQSDYFSVECLTCHSASYTHSYKLILREAEEGKFSVPTDMQQILAFAELDSQTTSDRVEAILPDILESLGLQADGDWDTLYAHLEVEAKTNTLPDLLPELLTQLEGQDDLQKQLIHLALAQAELIAEGSLSSDDLSLYGVTCSSCHGVHDADTVGANLRTEATCTLCHSDALIEDGIHHPTKEVFEGITLLENIPASPSGHFAAEDGPTCTTCHMAAIPVERGVRATHSQTVLLPGKTTDPLQDSCSICHGETVSPQALGTLIQDIQSNTTERLAKARGAVTPETPDWVNTALDIVAGDGSAGLHNPVLIQQTLLRVEQELGLGAQESADEDFSSQINTLLPEAQAAPIISQSSQATGLAFPVYVILGISALIMLVSGFVFFREKTHE